MSALILLILAIFIQVFWGGYALSVLWGWFVVPLGVEPVTALHAAGLSAVFGLFMGTRGSKRETPEDVTKHMAEMVMTALLLPLLYLGIGWAIRAAM